MVESVDHLPLQAQLDALDLHALRLFRSDIVRPTDTVESLFARLGLSDPAAAAYLRQDAVFRTQLMGRYGRSVSVEANEKQGLEKLIARWTPARTVSRGATA